MSKPFRFAVQISSAPDGKAWRDLVRRIEDLGYSTVFMPDHLGDQWGPLVGMTVAAEATERLRVGWLVLDNDYRHPAFLAKEVATLDVVSEGRVEFGIGAGWMRSDYEQSGIALDPPAQRIDRMVEGLHVMRSLWTQGSASFEGAHYRVQGLAGAPRPVSRPHPPVIIGGGGRRVLSIAAREADIVGINPSLRAGYVGPEVARSSLPDRFRERVAWVREAAGERFEDLELQVLTFFVQVVQNRDAVAEQLAPLFGLSPAEALDVPLVLLGTVEQIVETLQQRREELGFSYVVVHEPEVDAFAPVVAALAGT